MKKIIITGIAFTILMHQSGFVAFGAACSGDDVEMVSGASKVGIRPLPRTAVEEPRWHPGGGIGYYNADLAPGDFVARHMDVIKDYSGNFQTRQRFFEWYVDTGGGHWVDTNPETSSLVGAIRKHERSGASVKHIIIAREGWLYDHIEGFDGPIPEDPRILFQRDVDEIRQLFKDAHEQGLLKHDNYKLIQMVREPAAFLDNPQALEVVKTMDGICYESHQFNIYWPFGELHDPADIARGAEWTLEHGLDYVFYFGPVLYKDCDGYYEFIERDWMERFWAKGLPKRHPLMYYYLNIFPHACGSGRPVGPESNPNSYLGFSKWLLEEVRMPVNPATNDDDETR